MTKFGFEDLGVWQKTVEFSKKVIDVVEQIQTDRKNYRLMEQLEACSTSIALNIAEGKGRYSKKEFIQFLHIALFIIFHKNNWITNDQLEILKTQGNEIGKCSRA